MTTVTTPRLTRTLSAEYRGRLMGLAHEARFPAGIRLFNESGRADHFWIIQSGTVALDMRVPGRRPVGLETLGLGELLGWSWLYPPHVWQFGAETVGPVRAHEFDAGAVRRLCADDPAMGHAVTLWVGGVVACRLHVARTRVLDLYAPTGAEAGADPGLERRPHPTPPEDAMSGIPSIVSDVMTRPVVAARRGATAGRRRRGAPHARTDCAERCALRGLVAAGRRRRGRAEGHRQPVRPAQGPRAAGTTSPPRSRPGSSRRRLARTTVRSRRHRATSSPCGKGPTGSPRGPFGPGAPCTRA